MSNTSVAEIFNILPRAKTAVIIDGAHLYGLTRTLGFSVDFAKLRTMLSGSFDVRRMCYLLRVVFDEAGEIQEGVVAQLLDYLRFNGYRTIIDELTEMLDQDGRRITRNSNDVPIAVAMMTAVADGIPEIILVAGSSSLTPVVELCQRSARVTLISSIERQISVSEDLRSAADWFVDLDSLKDRIARRDKNQDAAPQTIGARARIVRAANSL
jgi:uncharacterized LabA/DUF88 family protein